MPLLGRSSKSNSPTGSQLSGAAINQAAVARQQRPQVCESPLFGTRRQLPMVVHQVASSSTVVICPPGSSGQAKLNSKKLDLAETQNYASEHNELSSIPQQITSQQIHYAFSIIDTNKDGMIDLKDLSQMLANLGLPIDEAILSHLMSTVSKRGDNRISEQEFLDWLSKLIQINDSAGPAGSVARSDCGKRAPSSSSGKTRVSRSSTAGSSLVAQPGESASARNRRGSGSGLALMRSLSASASQTNSHEAAPRDASSSSSSSSRANSQSRFDHKSAKPQADLHLQKVASELDDTRDDLRAAFCVFDLDGDGFITLDEVRAGLKLLGESWSPAELRQVFSKCKSSAAQGSDHSRQRISIEEFVQLLL